MRSNLSFENFASVLAALGATRLRCVRRDAAQAGQRDRSGARDRAGRRAGAAGQSSCSAAGCSGKKTADAPAAAAPGATPATNAAAPSTPPADPTPTPAAAASPAAATPPSTSASPTAKAPAKTTAKKKPAAKPAQGEASCGAGTCSGDKKQILVTVGGVGLGLRWEFLDELVERTASARLPLDFFEISPENYMRRGGRYPAALGSLAQQYPVVTHGLTMSLGGVDPLDDAYLVDLAAFLREVRTPWHSDHLCFGAVDGRAMHDLLPVSFKEANIGRIADRIRRARDVLGMPLAIENVSYYWHPGHAEMGEAEFLARVCDTAECGLLLDVNNAFVNATNFGFPVNDWMRTAPLDRVVQIHVAGHEWVAADEAGLGDDRPAHAPDAMIIDTHGADVSDPVLALLGRVLARTGPVPVVLERDQNVPGLDALLSEVARIRAVASAAVAGSDQDAALAEVRQ